MDSYCEYKMHGCVFFSRLNFDLSFCYNINWSLNWQFKVLRIYHFFRQMALPFGIRAFLTLNWTKTNHRLQIHCWTVTVWLFSVSLFRITYFNLLQFSIGVQLGIYMVYKPICRYIKKIELFTIYCIYVKPKMLRRYFEPIRMQSSKLRPDYLCPNVWFQWNDFNALGQKCNLHCMRWKRYWITQFVFTFSFFNIQ